MSASNPYQSSAHETTLQPESWLNQRVIFTSFVVLGLLSWSAIYAIRDIPIVPPAPPQQQKILWLGLVACITLGIACAGAGCFGIYHAVRSRVHPFLLTILYLCSGIGLCYASGMAIAGYAMIYGG